MTALEMLIFMLGFAFGFISGKLVAALMFISAKSKAKINDSKKTDVQPSQP